MCTALSAANPKGNSASLVFKLVLCMLLFKSLGSVSFFQICLKEVS